MWRLFLPLRYFALENRAKRWIDVVPTTVLSLFFIAPYALFPGASFFRTGGLLDKLLPLTSALTGFYVAALVAAATFALPDLDRVIAVGPVFLKRRINGEVERDALTRRELACTIFGYLAASSLLFSLAAALVIPLTTAHLGFLHNYGWVKAVAAHQQTLRLTAIIGFSLVIAHICTVTGLGIYYLMDRLYTRTPQVLPSKGKLAA